MNVKPKLAFQIDKKVFIKNVENNINKQIFKLVSNAKFLQTQNIKMLDEIF